MNFKNLKLEWKVYLRKAIQSLIMLNHHKRSETSGNIDYQLQPNSCDKYDELPIVLASYAVVQPVTVMVKVERAPVANSAMLRFFLDEALTNLTLKRVSLHIELFILFLAIAVSIDHRVSWINERGVNCKCNNYD